MKLFYLQQSDNGYFVARYINKVTGRIMCSKSTHLKDYDAAYSLAMEWYYNGLPDVRLNSRSAETGNYQLLNIKQSLNDNPYTNKEQTKNELTNLLNSLTPEKIDLLRTILSLPESATEKKFEENNSEKKNSDNFSEEISENFSGENFFEEKKLEEKKLEPEIQITDSEESKTKNQLAREKRNAAKKETQTIPMVKYLYDFWDFENSEYIKSQLAHGFKLTERHAKEMRGVIKRYYEKYFGNEILLSDIDSDDLEEFYLDMRLVRNLAGATVNKAINAASVPFKWAVKHDYMKENPLEKVARFSVDELKRGIPEDEEVRKLFQHEWSDKTSKLASMVAAFCGLRAGEISGLRVCDIGKNCLYVRHSWSDTDGLKSTKNNQDRKVPIMPELSEALLRHARLAKNFSDVSYVFFSPKVADQPLWPSCYVDALYDAMKEIGISEEQRKERNIVFHSWRHYYAVQMSRRIELQQAQMALGHLTPTMTEHYADHKKDDDFNVISKAMQDNFKNIISFPIERIA